MPLSNTIHQLIEQPNHCLADTNTNVIIITLTFIMCRDFVNYFKERVVPKANRLGKWALGEVNISLRKIFCEYFSEVNTFEENI